MITNNTALLDAKYIKEHSIVYSNVEDKFITPAILRCQNFYIKDVLGAKLFNTVINEYRANMVSGTTISTRINELCETFILPTLMYYVIYDTVDDFSLKITAQGILKPKTIDAGDAPDMSELDKFKKRQLEKAEYYVSQMVDFLCLNSPDYPEFLQSDADDSTTPNTQAFTSFSVGGQSTVNKEWRYWHPNLN